jgi:plasmid stabilization system protein ParE
VAQVIWLTTATKDAVRLFYFLEGKDVKAAGRMLRLLDEGALLLVGSPRLGMLIDNDRREFYMPFGGGHYVLSYMQDPQGNIVIIRVWHSRENRNPV